jgi:heptosyltransferase III
VRSTAESSGLCRREDVLQQVPIGDRVAVIRLRSLGDCILTTPALEILRGFRPDLRVAVVAEESFHPVFMRNPAVDLLLPPRTGRLRAWRPRLCLNLHGGSRSALLTLLSEAPLRAGFSHFRFSRIYNVRIPRAQEILGEERPVHTAEHLASAIFYLGAPSTAIPRAKLFAEPLASGRGAVAVLHPLASHPLKTWPAPRFIAVARHLRASGIEPVFIAGRGEDLNAFAGFRTVCGAPLSHVMRLLASAVLFIGNDSGPAHMAAALGIPVVVLFGASSTAAWQPWKAEAEVLAGAGRIDAITTEQVLEAVARLRVCA